MRDMHRPTWQAESRRGSSRREFLRDGLFAAAYALLVPRIGLPAARDSDGLVPDPAGILDLPPGHSYTVLSRAGDRMDDGELVPAAPDGMAVFAGPAGNLILIRNHELGPGAGSAPVGARRAWYDADAHGGTTTLVYDPRRRRVLRQFRSLGGTLRNCAGGVTPWGSWLTCEEFVGTSADGALRHGYCFEVPARTGPLRAPAEPLKSLGRFNHEAAVVEPRSGCVYLTEDRADSLLYRFLPERRGDLRSGRLEALRLRGTSGADLRNWSASEPRVEPGAELEVEWVALEEIDGGQDDLRLRGRSERGAAIFARGEGICVQGSDLYFACTAGGAARLGQVWRYRTSPEEGRAAETRSPARLRLHWESADSSRLRSPDNLAADGSAALIVCEDGDVGRDRLFELSEGGATRLLAHNALNDSELAGAAPSPDGETLFVNIQTPGITLAIHRDPRRRR